MTRTINRNEFGSLPLTLALATTLVMTSLLGFQAAQIATSWLDLRKAALDHAYLVAGHLLTGNQGCQRLAEPRLKTCEIYGNQVEVVFTDSVHTFIGRHHIQARAAVGFRFPEP